jgi:two-component system, chemotaxis family, CheB/CheR fusion protein
MTDQPDTLATGFSQLVVVGASAGGIDALQTLAASLPPDFPAPIVVAQHISPNRPSALAAILAKATPLSVRSVSGRAQLEPGTIYVVPPNHHVEIVGFEIVVSEDEKQSPLPSIDLLFTTAASAFGENAIAVVLTGTGTDGAAGAWDIKAAGGTVVIQNPETASFPSLPLALSPSIVDIVADLETISTRLVDLLTGLHPRRRPENDGELRDLLDHLRERTGIDFNAYKPPTITRRLQRRMAANQVSTLSDYISFLEHNPEEYQRLASSFLIKVTEFFRDPDLYDHLREEVLPEVLSRAREVGELRIWSAGCATGEEAYSLAMLLAEELGAASRLLSIRIFATDLDAEAVAFARRGVYPRSALHSLPEGMIERYFSRNGESYEVKKEIRSLVVFGQHDLAQRAPFPRLDIALCRNVLIYFTADLQKRALNLFAYSLRDQGYLILGKAETVSPVPELFSLAHPRLRIYRRVGQRIPVPIGPVREPSPVTLFPVLPMRARAPSMSQRRRPVSEGQKSPANGARADAILARLPVGVIVVDRKYDVLTINSVARRLLGVYGPALGEDLIHQARHIPSHVLRAVVDAALQGEATTTVVDIEAKDTPTGELLKLEIQSYPETAHHADSPIDAATVVITDVSTFDVARQERDARLSEMEKDLGRLTARVEQLSRANKTLLEANEDLAAINAETRFVNEELLVDSEEIQTATEEVETLNEELQATNEELETLNEELQATVEELNTTNDDLQARSQELQDLAVSLESQRIQSDAERERIQAILNTMGDAVLVVDSDGEPVLTNPAFRAMFGEHGEQFVPKADDGRLLMDRKRLQHRIASGESFTIAFTMTASDKTRRWFEAFGQPLSGGDEQRGVIVIRDITDRSMRRMQEEFLALVSHELRSPLTSLSGSIQLLQRGLRDDASERTRRLMDTALSQSRRLTALIEDLVDAARLQTGRFVLHMERVDLVDIVEETIASTQVLAEEQAIVLEPFERPLLIEADRMRIEQVLINLLTNAITYSPDADRIDVRLERDDGQGMVALHVQDYGVGIDEQTQKQIFERFFQLERAAHTRSSESGLGLGLFICREIVAEHGGTISVDSTPGAGSTFTVHLPIRQSTGEKHA